MLTLHRLQPQDDASWGFFPTFRRRVLDFAVSEGAVDKRDAERLTTDLYTKFALTPQIAGFWLMLEGETVFGQQVIGHIASWIDARYDRPYLMVFQAKIEDHEAGHKLLQMTYDQAVQWVAGLNMSLRGNPTSKLISHIEFWTERDAKAWARLLPELQPTNLISVMRIPIGETTPDPRRNGRLEIVKGGPMQPPHDD
jgi:hypothetical protein